jgi:hypothetical protein
MGANGKKVPYDFDPPQPGWIESLPDGDYTVGRGADPRSLEERASSADPTASEAPAKRRSKRRPPAPREA